MKKKTLNNVTKLSFVNNIEKRNKKNLTKDE